MTENVATPIEPPSHRDGEITPLSEMDARSILEVAAAMRNGARWSAVLALGLRQCEALGMRWSCIDFANGTLRVFQVERRRYRHGCANPYACGIKRHVKPCKAKCERHKKRCPKPCRKGCQLHAQFCPERLGGDWTFKEPKGGKARSMAIPLPLLLLLKEAKEAQAKESVRPPEYVTFVFMTHDIRPPLCSWNKA